VVCRIDGLTTHKTPRFITLLSGATAAWRLPRVLSSRRRRWWDFMSARSPRESARVAGGLPQGFNEAGYFEGRNVAIRIRWAEGKYGPASQMGRRSSSSPSECDRCNRRSFATHSKSANPNNSYCICCPTATQSGGMVAPSIGRAHVTGIRYLVQLQALSGFSCCTSSYGRPLSLTL